MIILLSCLVALPCFSSVLESDGAQRIIYSRETAGGYLAHGSLSAGWNGMPQLVSCSINQSGIITSQTTALLIGEPLCATDFLNGSVVVCNSYGDNVSHIFCADYSGSEEWITQLSGDILDNPAIGSSFSEVIVAGNDSEFPRVLMLDDLGNVLWDQTYTSVSFSVRDVCFFDDKIYVLGTAKESGWQSNLCILVLNTTGGTPELHSLFSGAGRCSPEAIEVDSRGLFILLNTMTSSNNMIYETSLLKLSFAFETLWTGSLSGPSWERGADMVPLANGGFVVCGWTNSLPLSESNRSDMILSEFDENGQITWSRTHGTLSTDYGLSIAAVSDGGFVVSGCVTQEFYQGWLLKTDSLGMMEPQGVDNSQSISFDVWPEVNPVRSTFLSLAVTTDVCRELDIRIYDITGRVVERLPATVSSGNSIVTLPFALPEGVYSVRVQSEGDELVFRTVVCGSVL